MNTTQYGPYLMYGGRRFSKWDWPNVYAIIEEILDAEQLEHARQLRVAELQERSGDE